MNRYVIGSAATGEILRSVECDPDQLEAQAGDGEVLDLHDDATPETHYFLDGALMAYTPEQAAAKRVRPEDAGWSNAAFAWIDARDLARRRLERWAAIKAERDARIAAPKQTSLGAFDADLASQDNLNKVIALTRIAVARGYPDAARYTLASNARQLFTVEQLETAALEMGAQVQGLFDAADALRQQIDASDDPDSINWPP
ncbi:MAG TPA: DUF4376 domain-containing protein [Burkholderiaceae bacterium]|nr:DUF4376 domain-containing protein [Burkholderiaceae bacterium]